jgi:hypothetical protein
MRSDSDRATKSTDAATPAKATRARRLLFVFVDALGPAQLDALRAPLGGLPHARTLDGILGYSSGALPTILTGRAPREHGRMCLFARAAHDGDSLLSPLRWLGLLPRVVHERGVVRRALGKLLARASDVRGYVALHRVPPAKFRWLDLPERDDLFGAREVGGAPTFLADARDAGLSVYASPWQLGDEARWAATDEALRCAAPDLCFLYAPALDATLHAHGNDTRRAYDIARDIGAQIDRARARMSADGRDVATIVVGDHGMGDVAATIDPRGVVDAMEARSPSLRSFVDSTMLRLWAPPHALERARIAVARARWPGRWLDAAALDARGAPTRGAPYGDAIFVLDEGVIFAPSHVGGHARGMHGYDLDAPSSRAALASDVEIPTAVRALSDVAGFVRAALALPEAA